MSGLDYHETGNRPLPHTHTHLKKERRDRSELLLSGVDLNKTSDIRTHRLAAAGRRQSGSLRPESHTETPSPPLERQKQNKIPLGFYS